MRPTLFILPQLPQAWLVPLCAVALLLGAALSWRVSRLALASEATSNAASNTASNATSSTRRDASDTFMPLLGAVAVCVLLFVSSRNPITLHSYGLMLVLGFGASVYLSCREAQRRGINPNIVLDLALPLLFWSIIACRIVYVVQQREQFPTLGQMLRIWDGGLSFHGSLVAAPLVVWYYARKNGLGFGQLTDCIAPSAFLGYAIGRVGCFLNGCCYGHVCDLPWAMQFPDEHKRAILTPPSHPAQLYSTILGLVFFAWMWSIRTQPQWNRFAGQLTLLFFALSALERFIMEVFRNGATAPEAFGNWLTLAQLVSVVTWLIVAALWIMLSKRSSTRSSLQPPVSSL